MKRVVVVQHVALEGLGRMAPLLAQRGVTVKLVEPGAPVPTGAERQADGIIVLGGPAGVYDGERFPRLRDEMDLLREAVAARVPVLGICLGSQILAAALGAKVYPGKAKEIGWHDVSLEPAARDDALFRTLPARFKALHWHNDVFELPSGAAHLARSSLTPYQAFSYNGCAWGLLFHLEADEAQVGVMAREFASDVRAVGTSAEALVEDARREQATIEQLAHGVFSRWLDLL